ncbi:MAG: ATP-binding cassette domain-containing protein [Polyangiaceae bacterium]|nr:ATP-binding cassette domain-containing protein [Polyangiaceae bacterium]
MTLFEVARVGVSVEGRRLLEDVSLTLDAGELVGVVGPSGCGKTELLRTLGALRDPDSGAVRVGGRAPSELSFPVWRRRVTYVAQRPVMLDGTVRENLHRPSRYASVGATPDEDELRALLERLALAPAVLDQVARKLSVGEQQRVALIRALGIRPSVVLLDEPTSALDPEATARVEDLVRARAQTDGLAAIIVSHDPEQRARWTSRRLDLSAHRARGTGTARHG